MNSYIQDLESIAKAKKQEVRTAIYHWLVQFDESLTHAVTFTINPNIFWKIDRFGKNENLLTDAQKVLICKKNFEFFIKRLNRAMYGNACYRYGKELLIIPIIEGQYQDGRLHFHCGIGIPNDRKYGADQKILKAWRGTPLAGFINDVKPYKNKGWLSYISKQAVYLDRESIAWDQVRVPKDFFISY
jgi:hypothetical protein